MIDRIYVETSVIDSERAQSIIDRFPRATVVECGHYGEIFNRHRQSFRLGKRRPALILAEKQGDLVQEAPVTCRIGDLPSYYFSTMLNCLYDCRYCFLQGMFRSANYVLFVNDAAFEEAIEAAHRASGGDSLFFSGFDGDSLALESISGFAARFVPWFDRLPGAWLELRTKSVKISPLIERAVAPRTIVAFSLAPESIVRAHEHGAPSVDARLRAMRRVAEAGWWVGARFDPVILDAEGFAPHHQLLERFLDEIPLDRVHSVTLGPLRFPKDGFERIVDEYPDEPLFATGLEPRGGVVTIARELEVELLTRCRSILERGIDSSRIHSPTLEPPE